MTTLRLTQEGYNYVDFYPGEYTDNNSLQNVADTGANSVALTPDWGIDVADATVYAGASTTDGSSAGGVFGAGNVPATIADAAAVGLSTFVRPLVDYLYPQASATYTNPQLYYAPNGDSDADPDAVYPGNAPPGAAIAQPSAADYDNGYTFNWRGLLVPTDLGSANVDPNGTDPTAGIAAFFGSVTTAGSYDWMIYNEALAAARAGASLFSIGTELDTLADNSAATQYWDTLIAAIRAAAPDLKLTYSASWNTANQVTFWDKLDVVGVDEYAPISNVTPASAGDNPSLADLIAGWTETNGPSAPAIGTESLIDYFDQVAANAGGKPLIFAEGGYANDVNAAANPPAGGGGNVDPTLQANLYSAFFDALGQAQQTAANNGGLVDGLPFALTGAYFWNWDPNQTEPAGNDSYWQPSPQAQAVIDQAFNPNSANIFAPTTPGALDGGAPGPLPAADAPNGLYLWSNAANWANGLWPLNGSSVVVNDYGVDDFTTTTSLASLTLGPPAGVSTTASAVAVTAPSLTIQTLVGDGGFGIGADSVTNAVTLTIGAVTSSGVFLAADGAAALLIDNSPANAGEGYVAVNGGTVELTGTPNSQDTFDFSGEGVIAADTATNTGTLILTAPSTTASNGLLENMGAGDMLELPGTPGGAVTMAVDTTTATLTVTTQGSNGGAFSFALTPAEAAGGLSGLTVESVAACYCPGTRILTPSGEIPIEEISIGMTVLTAAGAARAVRWIGRRSYFGRFLRRSPDLWPVRIRAGALADGVPKRDLMISPLHAMLLDGVLVPAACLVNGATIARVKPDDRVEYIHLELDTHDVIVAEGAASESFVDDDSRMLFQNAFDYFERYPDAVTVPAVYCAPRVTEGFALAVIRQRLGERAGVRRMPTTGPLRGYIDVVADDHIQGWAQNPERPDVPVCLDILVRGKMVAQVLANHFRADLKAAGLGSGRHAFSARLSQALPPALWPLVTVRRSSDLEQLRRSEPCSQAA